MSKPRGGTTESLLFFDETLRTMYGTCLFLFHLKILKNTLDTHKTQNKVFFVKVYLMACVAMSLGYIYHTSSL